MALKQDPVYLCPTQGNKIESVVIRECTLVFFLVLNRVRVSNPQRLTYTQILVEYPPIFGGSHCLTALTV